MSLTLREREQSRIRSERYRRRLGSRPQGATAYENAVREEVALTRLAANDYPRGEEGRRQREADYALTRQSETRVTVSDTASVVTNAINLADRSKIPSTESTRKGSPYFKRPNTDYEVPKGMEYLYHETVTHAIPKRWKRA